MWTSSRAKIVCTFLSFLFFDGTAKRLWIGIRGKPDPTISPRPTPTPTTAAPTVTPEPTVFPTMSPTDLPSAAPTDYPTSSPTDAPSRTSLFVVGKNEGPYGRCEGHCKDDDDCREGLRCQRRGGYEFVPGCGASDYKGVNFCYDDQFGPAPPSLPSGSFKLRLYWERGYEWQQSSKEAFWCMEAGGSGSQTSLTNCRGATKFEMNYVSGPGDMIKISGKDRCLDRSGARGVYVQDCDENNMDQRWVASWSSFRFDLRPANRVDMCATNHHHPRNGELISVVGCGTAHGTYTGFWEMY